MARAGDTQGCVSRVDTDRRHYLPVAYTAMRCGGRATSAPVNCILTGRATQGLPLQVCVVVVIIGI